MTTIALFVYLLGMLVDRYYQYRVVTKTGKWLLFVSSLATMVALGVFIVGVFMFMWKYFP